MISLPLDLRKKVAEIVAPFAPRSLRCTSCGIPGEFATMHLIHYARVGRTDGNPPGMIAICEDCHHELPREERLMAYLERVRKWEKQDPSRWRCGDSMPHWMAIIDAVMLEDTEWQEYDMPTLPAKRKNKTI